MRDEPLDDKAIDAAREILQPFLGEGILQAYERAKVVRQDAFKDMVELTRAAKANGMTTAQIRDTLQANRVLMANVMAILRCRAPKWRPGNRFLSSAIKRAETLFDPETKAEFERRRDLLMKP